MPDVTRRRQAWTWRMVHNWKDASKNTSILLSHHGTGNSTGKKVGGVKSIHIWGVIYSHALGPLLYLCNQNGINLSTDSAGPQVRPAAFGTWGYAEWKDSKYKIHPVETRGQEREKHVIQTRKWLSEFEKTKWYKPPQEFRYYPKQGMLF